MIIVNLSLFSTKKEENPLYIYDGLIDWIIISLDNIYFAINTYNKKTLLKKKRKIKIKKKLLLN